METPNRGSDELGVRINYHRESKITQETQLFPEK